VSYWLKVRFRDAEVFAACDLSGEFIQSGPLVEFCYSLGGKRYRTRPEKFEPIDGQSPVEHGASAATSKSKPSSGATGRGGDTIELWTDGACTGNPGPAGAGVVFIDGQSRQEVSEYLGEGTNNIAELTAILRGLELVTDPSRAVDVMTDSSYCIGLLTKGWKAKANQELVATIRQTMRPFASLQFVKVKGHAGIELNERADALAREAVERRC
jgi:ribonuclease HI